MQGCASPRVHLTSPGPPPPLGSTVGGIHPKDNRASRKVANDSRNSASAFISMPPLLHVKQMQTTRYGRCALFQQQRRASRSCSHRSYRVLPFNTNPGPIGARIGVVIVLYHERRASSSQQRCERLSRNSIFTPMTMRVRRTGDLRVWNSRTKVSRRGPVRGDRGINTVLDSITV